MGNQRRSCVSGILLFLGLQLSACGAGPRDQFAFPNGPPGSTLECAGNEPSISEPVSLLAEPGELLSGVFWSAHAPRPKGGIIFVSGVDGGWIEPADRIYQRTAEALAHQGVASVFVRYRNPGELEDSVADAARGAQYLRELNVQRMALVGWSFGGAVIAHAAARIPEAVTIIGFASQSKDTEPTEQYYDRSILLIHSRDDENVPFSASQEILDGAPLQTKKRLVALDGYNHLLDGAGPVAQPIVLDWLREELRLPN